MGNCFSGSSAQVTPVDANGTAVVPQNTKAKGNQVAPEPLKPCASRTQDDSSAAMEAAAPSHSAGASSLQQWLELQKLAELCHSIARTPPATSQQLAALEQQGRAALQQLEQSMLKPASPTAAQLRITTDACRACMDALLSPVASTVDRLLSHTGTFTSAPSPASDTPSSPRSTLDATLDETWDTISPRGLLQAMQWAAYACAREGGDHTVRHGGGGGGTLCALGAALRPLAELLHWEAASLQAQLISVCPATPSAGAGAGSAALGSFQAARSAAPASTPSAITITQRKSLSDALQDAGGAGAGGKVPAPLPPREPLRLLDLDDASAAVPGGGLAASAVDMSEAAPGVPAVDALVSMMGVVLFRRTVLESQASLLERQAAMDALATSLLGWPAALLPGCCSAVQRALLLALHAPAAAGRGERRVKLVVRRGRAFWDALEQVMAQHPDLLPPPESITRLLRPGPLDSKEAEEEDDKEGAAVQPCKLFPSFLEQWAGEGGGAATALEAGEGHGPRKEFFVLAGADAVGCAVAAVSDTPPGGSVGSMEARPALLLFNRAAGAYWFNTRLAQDEALVRAYVFLGWLVGQSLLNRAPLALPLPPLLLAVTLAGGPRRFDPSPAHVASFDPEAAASALRASSLPPADLHALLSLEGLPTTWTGAQYLRHAVRELVFGPAAGSGGAGGQGEAQGAAEWQAAAVAAGVLRALGRRQCRRCLAGAAELAAFLSGGADGEASDSPGGGGVAVAPLDLRRTFRVVVDEELQGPGSAGAVVGEQLWEVLAAWSHERQLAFVEFVTGTRRLPLAGTELLKVESPFVALGTARCEALLRTLPQAHTCDNLLELPNYWAALLMVRKGVSSAAQLPADEMATLRAECRRLLEDRLTTAITGCMGYGLDERS